MNWHQMVRAMEEQSLHALVVTARRDIQTFQHVFDGMHRLVQVSVGRVLAAEDGKVTAALGVRRVAVGEVASVRLPEVRPSVIGRASCVEQIHGEQLRRVLDEHGHGAGALRLLSARAALVLGDIGADHDRLPIATVVVDVT